MLNKTSFVTCRLGDFGDFVQVLNSFRGGWSRFFQLETAETAQCVGITLVVLERRNQFTELVLTLAKSQLALQTFLFKITTLSLEPF